MKVQVISKKIIKPSSPTPDQLRRYQLSFLDQISPRAYSPFIYFYALNDNDSESSDNIADISNKLKKSLSKALTLFYPLAGRFTDNYFVQCNDDGVPYFEALVLKRQLSDVIKNPVPVELNDLLPFPIDKFAVLPLGIQLNIFGCGGIAIGVCLSHRIADALSCLEFTRSWMTIARGEENKVVPPTFVSATLFPAKYMVVLDPSYALLKKHTIITKLFVFESRKLEVLRAKYVEKTSRENNNPHSKQQRFSRFEALSAFLWGRFVAATNLDVGRKFCTIFHPVNIRPRIDPPLPENSFGNYYVYHACVRFPSSHGVNTTDEDNEYCYGMARKIREELRKVDKDFVDDLRGVEKSDEYLDSLKKGSEILARGEGTALSLSSLCRFPLYEADFGCGKPAWVSSADRCFENVVALLDNKKGDGIEAYISLNPEDMARFEADKELLSLLSL
ncbi:Transferase [Parasponia andersonii]|uniref:Transferase n=1 Tax=Parasponia andersonii TaxID=3476 RepID=A0A2P5CUK2_PARAD|nr:Transferase [Parasponia andersonii]